MITRRVFLSAASAAALSGCTSIGSRELPAVAAKPQPKAMPAHYGPVLDEGYQIPAVPAGVVPERFWRQRVSNPFPSEVPGTIIVDTSTFFLHLVEDGGTAMRYGVGVGQQGFSWGGTAVMQYKRKWPDMEGARRHGGAQPGARTLFGRQWRHAPGLLNPLGARALYLFDNGEDTLYRIHGNPEAHSIGQAVSSGCIRLLNQDIIDLYERVRHRARVIVMQSNPALSVGLT
jgi:lipoprotein-anchoring transpeptidase ErfK/SrfK